MSGPMISTTPPKVLVVQQQPQMVEVLTGTTKPVRVVAPTGRQGLQGEPGPQGIQGEPGPPGPAGGTPVVALAYDAWPPVNPQPNTLYLRLAP